MSDDVIATLIARSPAIDAHDATLNLGATLKTIPTLRSPLQATLRIPRDAVRTAGAASTPQTDDGQQPTGYDILGELGRGGIGVVYRARQRTLRREVAVKRLQFEDAPMRQAFLAESMVTGELEHPNIVPVYALCEEAQGELWLVMKRIGGRTLAQLIADMTTPREAREIDRLLDVVLDVADALRFAHSRGILHRDVKPVNVMVGTFGEVMLLDWGIAAYFGDEVSAVESVPHVRDLDELAGTPLYMPPEMAECRGADCGPWTDVYLLGATLYEVITGKPARRGRTLTDVLGEASSGAPLTFSPAVPAELQDICRRAMAHDPAERYRDVESFQTALRDYLENRESRALAARAEEGFAGWRESTSTDIAEADRPSVYRAISEVVSSFQHAYVLWPGNAAARAGEVLARRAWAEVALDGGDLGIATTALETVDDTEADGLRQRIAAVRQERRRTLRFARWLGAGLIAGQALLIIDLGVFGWMELEGFTQAEILEELRRIEPAAAEALTMVDEVNPESLDRVADALGRGGELRLVLLDVAGGVVADSHTEPGDPLPPVRTWPEVVQVLGGAPDAWSEHPGARSIDVLSLATPWQHVDGAKGVLVLSLPRDTLDGSLHSILVGGLLALVLAFAIWSLIILRVSRRLAVSLSRVL